MFLAEHNLFNVQEKFQFLPGIKQLIFSQKKILRRGEVIALY